MESSMAEVRPDAPGRAANSSASSQVAHPATDAEPASSPPPREAPGGEPEEASEFRRLKVVPNGSLVRIVLNNRNSKGKAASYLGEEATVVSSANNGMGGWHEVQTGDGQRIKLQRNSLVVLKLGDQPAGSQTARHDADSPNVKPRSKRANPDSDASESRKRPRRQPAAKSTAATADSAIEPGTVFARHASVKSIHNYAAVYHLVMGSELTAPQRREQCFEHYRTAQQAVPDAQVPALLRSVQLALRKGQEY